MDYYTHAMLVDAISSLGRPYTFLRDRYFPTRNLYTTLGKMVVDVKEGSQKLAPFVAPMQGGKVLTREGFETYEIDAPYIKPKRALGATELNYRHFGEDINTELSIEERAAAQLLEDYEDMDKAISATEEYMCAQILNDLKFTATCTADDGTTTFNQVIQFYSSTGSQPNVYSPGKSWDDTDAKILKDLQAMVLMARKKGNAVTDMLVNSSTALKLIELILDTKMYDDRRVILGQIEQSIQDEDLASVMGNIIVPGANLQLLAYDGFYTNASGNEVTFLRDDRIILTTPGCGHLDYGAVRQMETGDDKWHTYAGTRVPKHVVDAQHDTEELVVTARPLPQPNTIGGIVVADVFFE